MAQFVMLDGCVTINEFKSLFTVQERIAIKTSTDPVVQDLWELIQDARTLKVSLVSNATISALAYLESIELLAVGRKEVILSANEPELL
jgi:hypothetical protein